ncbi:MAG: carboxypeptidase regulatory-like domain-containing protein [Acidobacteria bacterium]|nr:carboxypeptidase regulatory-like domain-containing protein [Acidobacteriota bacterium]
MPQMRLLSTGALIALALSPSLTFGQVSTATILGTITDPAGALVPEAEVVLVNLATGIETRSKSNATGNYRIQNI